MVKHAAGPKKKISDEQRLDWVFRALGDATRRKILLRIAEREHSVTELAEPFEMSLAAVSKHLKVLERAGLLSRSKDGRIHRCQMNVEPLKGALGVIESYRNFWDQQLNRLEDFLKQSSNSPEEIKNVNP